MVFAIEILTRDGAMGMGSRRRLRMRNHLVYSPYWEGTARAAVAFREVLLANLRKGAAAAKQIAAPAIAVQALMAALVLGYFYVPAMQRVFEQAVFIKNQMGLPFAFLSMGCIAIFAEGLKRCFDPASRATPFWREAGYGFFVFGVLGIITDTFYLAQGWMWQGLPKGAQVVAKVLTDQFVFTVLFANPYQTLLWVLKDCGFQRKVFVERLTPFKNFYAQEMLAVLIVNWFFWIPTTAILYSLPVNLQFVMAQLAIVIWVLLLNAMTKKG